MTLLAAPDRRFVNVSRKVRVFLAVAVLLVVGLAAAALVRHNVFAQTTRLYFFANSASGIANGMSVQLSGFKIGSVDDLELEPDARVKVRMVIDSKYLRFITQDSEAHLAREGMLGAGIIRIVPGSPEVRRVPNDGVLKFARSDDLSEKIDPILADVKAMTHSLGDPDGDLHQTLKNVRSITERFATTQAQLDRVLNDAHGATVKLDALLGDARGTLKDAGDAAAKVNAQLPALLLKLDTTLKNAADASEQAKRLTQELADGVPPVLRDGRGVARDTREIVQGAKKAWPIRNWVEPDEPRALPLDSHDGAAR